jgi:hypothetical protein
MQSQTLTGSLIKLYINNKLYKTVQSITFTVSYGEGEVRGIDTPWAQEIAPSMCSVKGSIQGIRLKMSGGLQAHNMRPQFQDVAASPYISVRIQDRSTGEDILLIPNAKISDETHTIASKTTYKLNMNFIGQIPLFALDRVTV